MSDTTEGAATIRLAQYEFTHYEVTHRPKTYGDALSLWQAFYDCGLRFSASDDEHRAKLDANPILRRMP